MFWIGDVYQSITNTSQFVVCLFIFLVVSSDEQKFLYLPTPEIVLIFEVEYINQTEI